MITLQHVLDILARMDVDPSEIVVSRTIYIQVIQQARRILREENVEDDFAENCDDKFGE